MMVLQRTAATMKRPSVLLLWMTLIIISLLIHGSTGFVVSPVFSREHSSPRQKQVIGDHRASSSNTALFSYNYLSLAIASARVDMTTTTKKNNGVRRKTAADSSSVVTELSSVSDLLDFLQQDDDDSLKIIKYHANYCKVCQRVKSKYVQIANLYAESKNLKFASMEVSLFHQLDTSTTSTTTSSSIHQHNSCLASLGVTRVPFVQVYRNSKCVASFSTGGASYNFTKLVTTTLEQCLQRQENNDWEVFGRQFQQEMDQNLQAQQELRRKVEDTRR